MLGELLAIAGSANVLGRMNMKTVMSTLLVLSVLAGVAGPASAACTVQKWTDGYNGAPVWKCDNDR
jgi:hypothetical protein